MRKNVRAAYSDSAFAFFAFRSEAQIVTVIIQIFLLFASFVVIIGIVYVVILLMTILVHHVLFDRDPNVIPDYVKNSAQFSSDSEADDGVTESDSAAEEKKEKTQTTETSKSQFEDDKSSSWGLTAQRKARNLDKFMNDLDTARQNIQRKKNKQ